MWKSCNTEEERRQPNTCPDRGSLAIGRAKHEGILRPGPPMNASLPSPGAQRFTSLPSPPNMMSLFEVRPVPRRHPVHQG